MIRSSLRRLPLALASLGLLLGVAAIAGAEADRPYVIKVHADWCGTCTRLNPVWSQLESRYGERAELVLLDVTDREAVARSRASAERLGIVDFFDAHKSKTGVIAVLDSSRQPIVVWKGETALEKYAVVIDRTLAAAAPSDGKS